MRQISRRIQFIASEAFSLLALVYVVSRGVQYAKERCRCECEFTGYFSSLFKTLIYILYINIYYYIYIYIIYINIYIIYCR